MQLIFDTTRLDVMRAKAGFLTIDQLLERFGDNLLLDPFSILISEGVSLGNGNILHPGVRICARTGSRVVLGSGNTLFSGAVIEAADGNITVGDHNEIGDGGFSARASRPGAEITIGSNGRYQGGASILGRSVLGAGTQLLGQIAAMDCSLEAGEDYRCPDPDLRGGVLKGFGIASNIHVPCGWVIAGRGEFKEEMMVLQTTFHPKGR